MVRNGTSFLYYKNGNIKSQWNFKNGLRDGLQKNFFGDGTLSDETETVKGVQNGFMKIRVIILKNLRLDEFSFLV